MTNNPATQLPATRNRRWRTPLARGGAAGPLAAAGLAGAVLMLPSASGYALRVLAVAGVYALLATGYRFIFGLAGALSLAQGTFMGVGAYLSGILAVRYGVPFDLALPASIGGPVLLALLIAAPVLRLQTHYLALATLLVGQVALLVAVQWVDVTGGANGIGGVPPLSVAGWTLGGRGSTAATVWVLAAAAAVPAWVLGRGRSGAAFALLRTDAAVARAAGIDTFRLRLGAFLLSAAYAGLAGSLYVHALGVLSPDVLGFPVTVTCLTIAVVGSRLRVAGALAGAVLVIELPEWARFLRDDYMLAFGCILLAVVVLAPGGLMEAADRLLDRFWEAPPRRLPNPAALPPLPPAPGGPLLEVEDLRRTFGGVLALDGVSLTLRPGEVLGVIGPNGSGKTTLLNAVSGIFPPASGAVRLRGTVLTGRAPHAVARMGVARTFQTAVLAPELSALDNVALARRGVPYARARAEALGLLVRLGAGPDAATAATALPPGVIRRVEIARALATRPRVLLLDEPAAGLDEAEQADLARRLRGIAADGVALLIVEHTMAFLLPLADRLLCLDEGRPIAAGTPAAVQADPRVVEAYLGTAAAALVSAPA